MEYYIEKEKRDRDTGTIYRFAKKQSSGDEDGVYADAESGGNEKNKTEPITCLVDSDLVFSHTPPDGTDKKAVKCMHCKHGTATYHEEKLNVKTAENKVRQDVVSLSPTAFGFNRCKCSRCLFKCDIDDTYHTPGSTCEHAEKK